MNGMNRQRSDLIAAARRAESEPETCCQCDKDAAPFSCYCVECEDEMISDEHGYHDEYHEGCPLCK